MGGWSMASMGLPKRIAVSFVTIITGFRWLVTDRQVFSRQIQ
jgi:hypothetical protein